MNGVKPVGIAAARPVTPVGIVAARLVELASRVETGAVIDADLVTEIRDLAALADGLDPYLERHAGEEDGALADLAARTRRHDWARHRGDGALGLEQEMLSGHVEARFLAMLVHATRARRVLEIGMFTGYAALAMAQALPDDGSVVTCETDPVVAALARQWFGSAPAARRIDVRVAPAADTLAALADERARFDLVFIDADKAGYADYFTTILDADLLAPHGLLCVDNTLMQGQPWTHTSTANGAAIAAFNDLVTADPRVEQVIVPLRDGITLVRRVDTVDTVDTEETVS